jgi:hypothetical protein
MQPMQVSLTASSEHIPKQGYLDLTSVWSTFFVNRHTGHEDCNSYIPSKVRHLPLESSSIPTNWNIKMCIKVRVAYPCCFHVHYGSGLCVDIDPEDGSCSRVELRPRVDPFCPLCSKSEYRAYKVPFHVEMNLGCYTSAKSVLLRTRLPREDVREKSRGPWSRERTCRIKGKMCRQVGFNVKLKVSVSLKSKRLPTMLREKVLTVQSATRPQFHILK